MTEHDAWRGRLDALADKFEQNERAVRKALTALLLTVLAAYVAGALIVTAIVIGAGK